METVAKDSTKSVFSITLNEVELHDKKTVDVRQSSSDNITEGADFEKAISETDFGLFNISMLLVAIPAATSSVFSTTTLSFVAPDAQCDLGLTLMHKGMMNAITYLGMILSAFLWGFLADTLGRKKLLVWGYLMDALCVVCSSFSQNVATLMIFKFIGGFIICGPFAVLMSYLTEFHAIKYRSRVVLCVGISFSLANIALPGIAWAVIPTRWILHLPNGSELHSWQIFLAFCALPSLLSGTLMCFLPESPKFLMSRGRNAEAMKVFQKVHRINHHFTSGQIEYSIKQLVDETKLNGQDGSSRPKGLQALKSGFKQFKPLFLAPNLRNCILVCTIQFLALLGLNTLRLWLPQLFAIMEEFAMGPPDEAEASLCHILETSLNKTKSIVQVIEENCSVTAEYSMYFNSTIVGMVSFCGYVIAGILINSIGNKNICVFGFLLSGCCGLALYWAGNAFTAVGLSALYCAVSGICTTSLIGIVVVLFPTDLRTMAVSLLMMIGRIGAFLGNLVFPMLLTSGCFPSFLSLGIVLILCGTLCLILPKTSNKKLE